MGPAQHEKIERRIVNWDAGGQKRSCVKKEGVPGGAAHSTGLNCSWDMTSQEYQGQIKIKPETTEIVKLQLSPSLQ